MSEILHFPFVQPWMSEAADPAATEPPALRLVQNGRFNRLGRVAKRVGVSLAGTGWEQNSPIISGRPMLLGTWGSRQILIAGDGLLYSRWSFTSWTAQDRVPTFTPEYAQEIARDDTNGPPESPSVAANSTFQRFMVAYSNGSHTVVSLFDDIGIKLWSATISGEFDPKLIRPGNSTGPFVLITRAGTALRARTFDFFSYVLSSPTGIGTLNSATDNWDANRYSTTLFAIVYRDATTQARVELYNSTSLALSASAAFTINNAQIMPAVWGQSPENIYVAWWDPTATRSVRARVYNSSLSLTSGGTVTMGDSVGFAVKPVIARRNATSAHILWGGNSSSGDRVTRHRTLANDGTLGTNTSEIRNIHIASEPFDSDEDKIRLWVMQAGSAYIFCRYVLVTLRLESFGTFEALPELHTDAGWVPHEQTYENLPSAQVARLGSGEYVTAVRRRIRGELGTGAVNNVGVVLLRYRGSNSAREAQRQGIEAQRVYHVTGGVLIEHMGSAYDESLNADLFTGIENNFLAPPFITAATAVAGGSLTSGATYQYCCVYEALDSAGRRTRSLPSNVVTVSPSGGNLTGSIVVSNLGVSGRRLKSSAQPVAIHVYRTLANGAIFYRASSDVAAPDAFNNAASQTITDALPDTDIDSHEVLYYPSQAGNYPCPSHRFAVQGGNRMFVGGLWDPTLIACSKPFVPDEPVQFVEDNAFRILSPVPVTGLGWMDGALVIFGEGSIYIVSGDGPDRTGAGGFGVPQRLPGDVGCSDWRTVREVPQGLLFQGPRGFYLLPRGFGAPVFQADIQDQFLTGGYRVCFGAGRHEEPYHGESSLVYLMGKHDDPASSSDVIGLVYNVESGKWVSVDSYAEPFTLVGKFGEFMAMATDDLSVLAQMAGNPVDDTSTGNAFIETHVRTGQVHPFGWGGFGCVQEVMVYGEWRGQARLGIRLKVDGLVKHELTASANTVVNAVNGVTLSPGDKFYFRWRPPQTQGNSFEVEVWDEEDTDLGFPTDGLWFNGLSLLVDPLAGHKPLGAGNRS